mmetsp:Transcript_66666/g.124472  ORF Transcript_66666/g.124472 Transcript_66666/m.124472 type:complete len:599 (-) Transcript_66666:75-1871(-)
MQLLQVIIAFISLPWLASAIDLNGFQGPMVGKAMNGNALGSVFYPTITFCAQLCDTSISCKAFSWGFRGNAMWFAYDANGQRIDVGLCVLHSVNSSSAPLDDLADYDFYEELAAGPTPDPSNAGLQGYIGPFNGTATSGINDITPLGGVDTDTAAECAALCDADAECRSFDFASRGWVRGDCHLSRVDRELAGPAWTVWPLYDYYEKVLPTIPEYVLDDRRDFSILAAAFADANLLGEISGPGPFTLFAPSDEALQAAGINTVSDLKAIDGWVRILEFHVALGRFESQTLSSGDQLLTVHGDKVRIGGSADSILIDGVGVRTANIECSNGVIHIIDGLLSPPTEQEDETIVQKLNTRGFTLLEQALISTGLATELANLAEDWTIFAPTDTAMEAFYLTEGLTRDEFLASTQVASILRGHVAMGRVRTAQADAGVHEVQMLEGESLRMQRTPGGGYFVQRGGAVAAMGPFDLVASDGLLHAIDRVLAEPVRADLGNRQSEGTSESDGASSGTAAGVIVALIVVVILLCLMCPAFFFYYYRKKSVPQIPETTVQQDGVTVVMGKPVPGQEAAAAAQAGKNKEQDGEAGSATSGGGKDFDI